MVGCLCKALLRVERAKHLQNGETWYQSGYQGLTSWLLFVMSICDFVTFPCGILGQVWYLIVMSPDLCCLSYLDKNT